MSIDVQGGSISCQLVKMIGRTVASVEGQMQWFLFV